MLWPKASTLDLDFGLCAWAKLFNIEEERLNDGDNNGQAMHGARKNAWHTQHAKFQSG